MTPYITWIVTTVFALGRLIRKSQSKRFFHMTNISNGTGS